MQKIRVAFFGYNDTSWIGGINYLKNLLFANCKLESQKIEAYIFLEINADPDVVRMFEDYANCILLKYDTPVAFFNKVLTRVTGWNYFLNYYLRKYRIDAISHSRIDGTGLRTKIICWIPDFQHLHLPQMFSKEELELRNISFRKRIQESDCMIVSSNDALKDCIDFEPSGAGKTKVLHFVSQIDSDVYKINPENKRRVFEKFKLPEKFFYLPNQFWKHKNHIVVYKAVAVLKNQGIDVSMVCSGNFKALDNEEYIDSLGQLSKELQIENNIFLLGMITYPEVQFLMRYSVSVINPSYFEGWSSSVEECKSMGKNMIVSDISVHKEQNPPETFYFNPYDENDLANKMKDKLQVFSGGPDFNLESLAKERLSERTLEFGKSYESIVSELFVKS
jgi:glycosyltransferase involved in cell wall biosynthesis